MIKPHGSDELNPLFVYDSAENEALQKEAEGLAGCRAFFLSCLRRTLVRGRHG